MTKIYLAGGFGWRPKDEGYGKFSKGMLNLFKGSNKLDSFYRILAGEDVDRERFAWLIAEENNVNVFLDSGAFSAWTQDIKIDMDAYIQFCLDHINDVEVIANLDVIPGRPYQRLPQKDIDDSAKRGWKNYQKMLDAGIPKEKLVHVFHQGEDMKWLQRMVREIPYIGLSPANDKTIDQKIMWLDRCMDYVLDGNGMPIVKFHGFAVTSLRLLLQYPWYSVDSTSWVITGRMGSILVPRYRDGEWIYDENSWRIAVSNRSPNRKETGQHIDTLSSRQRDIVLNYIYAKGYHLGQSRFEKVSQSHELAENEYWGEKRPKDPTAPRLLEIIEEEGICNRHRLRDEMNIIYFQDLEKSMPEWPWAFKRSEFKGARLL